jgi:hypothetical protein
VVGAGAKIEAASKMIAEADQRWYGLRQFLARSSLDRNVELVGRPYRR